MVGTDIFTYNNAISNVATVTVTVNNIAPTINNVTVESNIQEGKISTFSATATDPGNDLTYSWNFSDKPFENLFIADFLTSNSGDYDSFVEFFLMLH
jgi:hypothetical protein